MAKTCNAISLRFGCKDIKWDVDEKNITGSVVRAGKVNIMMVNGYVVLIDLFADSVVFRQSLWLISRSDSAGVAINLQLISCPTNKWPPQRGHCVPWVPRCITKMLVERCRFFVEKKGNTERVRGSVGGGIRGAENRLRKTIHKSLLSSVSAVTVVCDKPALPYLKSSMGQMVHPAEKRKKWNRFHLKVDFRRRHNPHTNHNQVIIIINPVAHFQQGASLQLFVSNHSQSWRFTDIRRSKSLFFRYWYYHFQIVFKFWIKRGFVRLKHSSSMKCKKKHFSTTFLLHLILSTQDKSWIHCGMYVMEQVWLFPFPLN